MATAEVPGFLTVEEAGRVLRIGRTTAYEQAHLWLDTLTDGLPVLWVGGSLRVPLVQFEQHYNHPRHGDSRAPQRRRTGNAKTTKSPPAQDIPRSSRSAGRGKTGEAEQDGLPFAG